MKKISWIMWAAITIILAAGGTVYFVEKKSSKVTENNQQAEALPFGDKFNTIIIGWDGVQRDHFLECYNEILPECPNGLTNIKNLSSDNIYNLTITNGATSTKPGWVQILTGYNSEVSGTKTNDNYSPIPSGYSLFEKVENNYPEIKTIFLAAKIDNLGGKCKDEVAENGTIELVGEPWCDVKNEVDYFQNGLKENEITGDKSLEMIEKYKSDRFLLFVHFAEPDGAGHKYGENSIEYSDAIIEIDAWLGKIVAKLAELNLENKTMIYVAADHGFDQDAKSHNNAPYSIYATNDQSVVRAADRRDIAPTILKKYGISLSESGAVPAVDGTPLDIIPTECVKEGESYLDYAGAPKCCTGLQVRNLDLVGNSGKITPATGGTGDNSGLCVK
ncbi:hypothetical protein A2215_03705 [Candidatus Berkelbacteria bacterium RIFOXYA2_FULL_43_10]|uniref:Metalloenzyme domain-containing protein n=1 Tax=Candidatus Berkelbacteria bacterium RIFOXYA2_FULL_43_10 TaxID=1797472 RepID=A0A1F5E4I9_9BACT|nr:MAG: hypothetical protein A2215_03705 [Candidatus Berkelbacteria bacterium RIFOXYA2_FULL_43_10]